MKLNRAPAAGLAMVTYALLTAGKPSSEFDGRLVLILGFILSVPQPLIVLQKILFLLNASRSAPEGDAATIGDDSRAN